MDFESATMTNASKANDSDRSQLRFCELCGKPFTNQSAYRRHVAYCRRTRGRQRMRKRACKECRKHKRRCSSEPQCDQCTSRDVSCEYERSSVASPGQGVSSDTRDLNPRHEISILFLLDVFRAVPQMMARRETFPMFIHGYWHMPEPPEAIVQCMAISQLHTNRGLSQQHSAAYNSALSAETSRLVRLVPTLTGLDLLAAFEAQIMYTILIALEDDKPDSNSIPELHVEKCQVDRTAAAAQRCFNQDFYAPLYIDNVCDPSETWEQFIYAESRRRCALFWFLTSRVTDLKYGSRCPPVLKYCGLALPSPDALWNARTREDWETARAEMQERRRQPTFNNPLRTFGDLVDKRPCSDPDSRRQLNNWFSSCGQLGMILLVASTMV